MRQHEQQVSDQRRKNLNSHSIFGTAQELLDLQVLLYPLEVQLDSPALFVLLCDLKSTARQIVRGEDERPIFGGAWPR